MKLSYPVRLRLLCPAVFLSGAAALVYEIVWTRYLSLRMGSTTGAAAAVLSAFMLGLALGAVLVGRAADSSRRPLRWYGLLEIGIGVYALAFGALLDLVGGSWLMGCAIVALPAALMGATLPVLARAAADTTERGTRAFGSLYGVNTLGAVAGAMFTTFLFLETLGLRGSTQLAASINIGLGVVFLVLDMRTNRRETFLDKDTASWTGDADRSVIAAFFVAGFAGLALQIAWVRTLVYFLEGFTIAFGLMLSTYLLGLGAGAIGGTWLALRSPNPRRLIGRVLLLQGVLAIATFLFVGPLGDSLEAMRGRYTTAEGIDGGYAIGLFWAALAVILPATLCAGALMPIVARIALSGRDAIGRQTGVVYAASTLGAVMAPAVAGFWIVPALGVPGTIALMAAVLVLAGTCLSLSRGIKEWVIAGSAAAVFVVIFLAADISSPLITRSHVFRASKFPRRLVAFREGLLGGVSVVEEYRDGSRRLYIDGFSAAETGRHYGYMRMAGHLPVLLHKNPETVCVIAFGTGTTAGAVSLHPEVKRVVCVEIEPRVYDVASAFKQVNRDVLNSPKTEAVVADGREFVKRHSKEFDVITLEPLMPYTPGAVYLYTKEFYEAVRLSLRRHGLLCQWIPPQGVSNADMKRLIASITSVFGHVSLWYFEHAVLVVGGDFAPAIDNAKFVARCARKEVLADLMAVVGGPDQLLAAHVVSGGKALENALSGAEPFVDDKTGLEFRPLPRRFGKRSRTYHAENLEFLAKHHQQDVDWLSDTEPAVKQARRMARGNMGAALDTLAREFRLSLKTPRAEWVSASVLRNVAERDPLSRFVQSIYQRRLYVELMPAKVAEAAALTYAPDRSGAFLALAKEADDDQALFYRLLALRENALLPADVLKAMALSFDGPQKRFLLNRARVQEGDAVDEGAEERPSPPVPDLKPALKSRDRDACRAVLSMARVAGLGKGAENQAWAWWNKQADKREAALFLHGIGSGRALHAARRLRSDDDQAALAVIFAAHYPKDRSWERLCRHRARRVREAAADAAARLSYTDRSTVYLQPLAPLLGDSDEGVRLSAFLAFRSIHPGAEAAGYDHRKPTKEAIALLVGLANAKAAAVDNGK